MSTPTILEKIKAYKEGQSVQRFDTPRFRPARAGRSL